MSAAPQMLIEKLEQLPPQQLAEVEDLSIFWRTSRAAAMRGNGCWPLPPPWKRQVFRPYLWMKSMPK